MMDVASSCPTRCLVADTPAAVAVAAAAGGAGTSDAEGPQGENESPSAAAEAKSKDDSRADAGQPPPLDGQAAEEDATKGAGGEEERARAPSYTRPRLPSDAQDRRGRDKVRKGKKKRRGKK